MDLLPQYMGSALYIHYGSPLITRQNTVVVPVKTGATDSFRVEGHDATTGATKWMLTSDYTLPPHNWTPSFGIALTPKNRVYCPGASGTVWYRDTPDAATGTSGHQAGSSAQTRTATGSADIDYDAASKKLTWKLTYTGLSGPATAAHFHGPAEAGKNGGVAVAIPNATSSPAEGSATLELPALKLGCLYNAAPLGENAADVAGNGKLTLAFCPSESVRHIAVGAVGTWFPA